MTEIGDSAAGFTLVEALIALLIMTYGLLAGGQFLYVALRSASLSRSKGNAAVAAQSKLAFLADLYNRDPAAAGLTEGNHGPEQFVVTNPAAGGVLNRYEITWIVSAPPDPRPGKAVRAVQVTITVAPVDDAGNRHFVPWLNKVVTVSSVLSPRPS